ncbi:HlyD family secretion protein [Flagellimonas beolgyonensis]|uniref:HlyD family secretion protein n=1 Tax=Flagellimonas beolgyonensis TaxID=864064 RepID=UPI003D65E287
MEENQIQGTQEIPDETSFFKKHRKIIRPIMILLAVVCLYFAGGKVLFGLRYVSTDNAQLTANIITLRTSVSGTVERIQFEDNQMVHKGDTLIVFDTAELLANLTRAQSQFYSAQLAYQNAMEMQKGAGYSMEAAGFNLSSQTDNLTAAQLRMQQYEKDFDRIGALFRQGAATKQAYENAQTQLDLAKSQVALERHMLDASNLQRSGLGTQRESATLQVKLAQANIGQAQANLAFAQAEYDKAFVLAPFDGMVSNRNINTGQYILGGTPLASLVDAGPMWVNANFKETQLEALKIGSKALITVDAYPSLRLNGRVESLGGATGAKFSLLPPDNSSGNFIKVVQRLPVKIILDSIPAGYALKPGYSVTANVRKD